MKALFFIPLFVIALKAHADSSSGCGLGWQVTKAMNTSGSFTRALTNGTFSNTFAMTSGTSGCDFHEIVKNEKSKVHFVESNLLPLQLEFAIGNGERVVAASKVFGCSDNSQTHFTQVMRKNHSKIFETGSPQAVVNEIEFILKQDAILKGQCLVNT